MEGDDEADVTDDVAVAFRGADFDWGGKCGGGGKKTEEELGGDVSRFSFESASGGGAGGAATGATPSSSGPTLKSVTLHVKRGELLGIAGPVGSGKSSLLLALLSELLPCPAAPASAAAADDAEDGGAKRNTGLPPVVRGSLAYCSQVPWIPPGTLRDAILFGGPFNAERYEKCIDAAALRPDLESLPAGDMQEIGERGINLSGGQRARVALARAAYADADVVLLDDPLSALDSRVGAATFERCISNSDSDSSMMAGKTRLLVTHARHYLPRCDRVAVVRNGEIVALGTPRDLAEQGVPELVAAVREAAAASGGDVDAAADAAGADDDEDQEGAGAAVAAILSNDVDLAGEVSEWDEGSRSQTPAAPLSVAGSDIAADASASEAGAARRSSSSAAAAAAASRLRRAISSNLRRGGERRRQREAKATAAGEAALSSPAAAEVAAARSAAAWALYASPPAVVSAGAQGTRPSPLPATPPPPLFPPLAAQERRTTTEGTQPGLPWARSSRPRVAPRAASALRSTRAGLPVWAAPRACSSPWASLSGRGRTSSQSTGFPFSLRLLLRRRRALPAARTCARRSRGGESPSQPGSRSMASSRPLSASSAPRAPSSSSTRPSRPLPPFTRRWRRPSSRRRWPSSTPRPPGGF